VINGGLHRLVSTARVADLATQADATRLSGNTGISHTRWATHGAPTPANAHPHVSSDEIAVVHNGIIENFEPLRERLQRQGYHFVTQTDTEVIAHLIHAHYSGDLLAAVRRAITEFKGAYAIAAISTREPGRIVGARAGSPLLVGIGGQDHFLASDASALAPVTQRVVYLEEGDVADITRTSYAVYDASGARAATNSDGEDCRRWSNWAHTGTSCREIFSELARGRRHAESVGGIGPELVPARRTSFEGHAVHIPPAAPLLLALVAGLGWKGSPASRRKPKRQRIPLSRQRVQSKCARGRHRNGRTRSPH
jgi:hypothetical protein